MLTFDLSIKNAWKKRKNKVLSSRLLSQYVPYLASAEAPTLYSADNIDQLGWPATPEGEFAKQYLTPLIKDGTHHYIDNIRTEMQVIHLEQIVLPLVIVNNNYENSYVCSPYGYFDLGLEKLHLFESAILRKIAEKGIRLLQKVLRLGKINQVIYVNNWLLSTDLYPNELSINHIEKITAFLKTKFPQHAIVFRSLNNKTTNSLKNDLKKCGYKFMVNRQVYLTNPKDDKLFKTRIIKSDLKLWREKDYEVIGNQQLSEKDEKRVLELYNLLSLQHHSFLNPRLNARFIKLMIQQKLFEVKALKNKNGSIDGVVGFFKFDQTFICPFFGYDKSHPEPTRLYRLLSTLLLIEASKQSQTFHQSAGASFYKKIRRATGYLEYQGTYTKHLPAKQRGTWWLLKTILNLAAIPLIKKY